MLFPEVDNDVPSFVHVQDHFDFATPANQLLHLLPVSQVMVIPDEAHQCCVIHKLHNVVGGSPWTTVVSHQSEQQGARDTALREACAEGDDTGGILTDSHLNVVFQ